MSCVSVTESWTVDKCRWCVLLQFINSLFETFRYVYTVGYLNKNLADNTLRASIGLDITQ